MKCIFNNIFVNDNKIIFYLYIAVIVIMILATLIFVIKELKKK